LDLHVGIQNGETDDIIEVANTTRAVEAWLELQSATLTSLSISSGSGVTLTLPPLPALQKLNVIWNYSIWNKYPGLYPIEALDPTRYPSLKTLHVGMAVDDAGIISKGPMESVEVLDIRRSWCLFTNPSWKLTFPNLTSLDLQFSDEHSPEDVQSSISFILTNFPALVHLGLCVRFMYNKNICLWDVLTGAAPRPNPAHVNTKAAVQAFHPIPRNGIYQISSLGNMRGSYWKV